MPDTSWSLPLPTVESLGLNKWSRIAKWGAVLLIALFIGQAATGKYDAAVNAALARLAPAKAPDGELAKMRDRLAGSELVLAGQVKASEALEARIDELEGRLNAIEAAATKTVKRKAGSK